VVRGRFPMSGIEAFINPPNGGFLGWHFCALKHPVKEDVWCRMPPEHDGDCAAYVFSIREPESWPRPGGHDD
jgi:hypothetical protein